MAQEDIMADVDYSSPEHRLEHLAHTVFFEAYACVRHFVFDEEMPLELLYFLRGYMTQMEATMAKKLDYTETSLVGKLVDLGNNIHPNKIAKDEGESSGG